MKKTALLSLLTCLLSAPVFGSTIYVNAAATGANDGSTWADAFTDLQSALTAAASGDQIWVAAGTYKPTPGTDRAISFVMKSGVAIYGGFPSTGNPGIGDRNWTNNVTTLSGDIGTPGDNTDNSYHVVFNNGNGLTSTAILDGFTISGGNGNGTTSPHNSGGGMYNSSSSPSVNNCTFSGNLGTLGGGMYNSSSSPSVTYCTFSSNAAGGGGGGIYNSNSSSPTVSNCTFSGNSTAIGGGIYNYNSSSPTVSNCTFSGNSATSTTTGGGGIYTSGGSPSISNCTFSGNSSNGAGGGIHNASSSTISDCTFSGNSSNGTASNGGGGIYSSSSSTTISKCTFSGNSANGVGGGLQSIGPSNAISLTNCLFLGNTAANGGGLNIGSTGSSSLVNCSFSGNQATTAGGAVRRVGGTVTLTNCILWGNSTEINGTVTATYSIVQGGFTGTGNLNANPNFASQPPIGLGTAGDLHLSTGSAAYNAGNNAAVPGGVATDLDGLPRIAFATVDMGAYEAQTVLPAELVNFWARSVGSSVELTWRTASESNNRGFGIERSPNGSKWLELAFMPGRGTTAEAHDYSFLDGNLQPGANYYRLRQVDFDGAERFSPVASIAISGNVTPPLVAHPNPVSGSELTLLLSENWEGKTVARLFDPTGRLVRSAVVEGRAGSLDVDGLEAGIYMLRAGGFSQKVVVRE